MFCLVTIVFTLLTTELIGLSSARICTYNPKRNRDRLLNNAKALVSINSEGNGFTLSGCTRDPEVKIIGSDLSDGKYCHYCHYTSGICRDKNVGALPSTYVESLEYPGYRLIASNGIPDHCFSASAAVCEKLRATLVPVFPTVSSAKPKLKRNPKGHVGFLKNGGFLVNDLGFEQSCGIPESLVPDGIKRDICGGHSHPSNCMYHYHGMPTCWPEAKNPSRCELLGFMHDGIAIFGYCTVRLLGSGATITMKSCYSGSGGEQACGDDNWSFKRGGGCNLDKANGFYFSENAQSLDGNMDFYSGQYAYFFTEEFPYTPLFYAGEATSYGEAGPTEYCGLLPKGVQVATLQNQGFFNTLCTEGSVFQQTQIFSPFQGRK